MHHSKAPKQFVLHYDLNCKTDWMSSFSSSVKDKLHILSASADETLIVVSTATHTCYQAFQLSLDSHHLENQHCFEYV